MIPPKLVEDSNVPPNTVYLIAPKFKQVSYGQGEPPRFKTELDWDATAKASAVIKNVGDPE